MSLPEASRPGARPITSAPITSFAPITSSAPITSFVGAHRFLSSFWPAEVELGGETYPTVEHAYQAAKTDDPTLRRQIRTASSPGEAKGRGSALAPTAGWADRRIPTMRFLLRQKFRHPELRAALLGTGASLLVEGNGWGDRFWGRCDVQAGDGSGAGSNHLGNLLMAERSRLAGWPLPELALDLEGTLVSTAVSGFVRPGVAELLDWAETRCASTSICTSVPTVPAHELVRRLVDLGELPPRLLFTRICSQSGASGKDLRQLRPDLGHLVLLDDRADAIREDQRDRWVPVEPWLSPYEPDDALVRAVADLDRRFASLDARALSAG